MDNSDRLLTLIRHAKSSWKFPLPDFERPLNKRGKRNAVELGQWLAANGIHFEQIVASPARRTMETATLIAAQIGYPENAIATDSAIYHASTATLLEHVRRFDDRYRNVALIGHNPGISALADLLLDTPLAEDMRTCACAQVRFSGADWSAIEAHSAELVFFRDPKSGDPLMP